MANIMIAIGKLNCMKNKVVDLRADDKINWEEYYEMVELLDSIHNNLIEEENKMTAKEYGKQAYNKGLKCVPAMDTNFLEDMIKGLPVGGGGIKLMKEWVSGWTEENLKDTKEVL